MFKRLTSSIRERWHPLWRLRRLSGFRRFQNLCDRTVYTRIPGTRLQVAVRLLRDASWIVSPASLEPEIQAAFTLALETIKPAVFWDVGANIGFYSWFVRQYPSVRQVVMFEPDPTNFALIGSTIRKNSVTDCQPMNVALSDSTGEASFLIDRASGATGSLEATAQRDNESSPHHIYQMSDTITCCTATVDVLIAEGVPAPQLIKIDVEGAEALVLAGAKSYLAQHRPTMIVETVDSDLVSRLVAMGYVAFRIDDGNLLFASAEELDIAPLDRVFHRYDLATIR